MKASTPISRFQWWYGRDEPPLALRGLRAGPVTANLAGRDLRNLRFGGTEIAQRVYVAVRDRDWGTVPGEVSDLTIEEAEDRFTVRFTVTHRQHDIDFVWRGEIMGAPNGAISYAMDATAGADMTYKLIGLNIHHGMNEYSGRPCRGMTPDGPIADVFPTEVAPQLVADETEVPIFPPVESLTARLSDEVSVRFDFEGDTFEFEDQRNWTDASFKSQSYPPRRNGFMTIRAGERVWQKVTVTPSGTPPPITEAGGPVRIELGETIGRMPPIGLGMASHGGGLSEREGRLLKALRLDHLRADLRLADPSYPGDLARAMTDARTLGCGLELALHLTDDAEEQLGTLASRLNGGRVDRVLVFHEEQLATEPRWVDLARRQLGDVAPDALVAGGTNANYCELNRFRPLGTAADGIVFSINPQIHAFDELSLTENLAAQAETVRTAQVFGEGRPVVVSPVTLKPRFNSVATSAEEPALTPGELPPHVDARQMSLFGAGWTVGSLKHLIESGVAATTYYETTGWRGVIQGDMPAPVPDQFPARPGMVFPVYHVFADLAAWKDGEAVSSRSSDPLAVETLAVACDGMLRLLVANLTPEPRAVIIDAFPVGDFRARRLNAGTAEAAAFDAPNFRSQTESIASDGTFRLALAPFEVACLEALRS